MNKLNFYQTVRSLLPKCSSDAKIFSSDVYKESTQARKYQADGLQYGRSMIEMLGVLAIVGILSVGAIAGYQKAMMKYKLNKQTQQLSHIMNVVSRYYKDLELTDENNSSPSLIPYLKKLNEIPKEMYLNEYRIIDIFKSTYYIYRHNTGYTGILSYINDSNYSREICKNIYLTAKEFSNELYSIFIIRNGSNQEAEKDGNQHCYPGSTNCLKDLTVAEATSACSVCKSDDSQCIIYLTWR